MIQHRRALVTAVLGILAVGLPLAHAGTGTEPDRIVFSSGSKLYTIRADGSGRTQVTYGPKDDGSPQWSPDRKHIAFTRATEVGTDFRDDPIFRHDIFVANADGGGLRLLVRGGLRPTWSPAGGMLAYLRYTSDATVIWTVRADGSGARRLVNGESPAWSPDGSRIAFERWTGDDTQVFVIGRDGRGERRLHADPKVSGSAPTWSPDGSSLAFFGDADDDFPDLDESLYVVEARGARLRRLLDVVFGEQDMTANWSPDGRTLLFVRYRQPSPRSALYTLRADGRGLKRLRLDTRDPEWSRDGRHIAFTNAGALYVMRADGTRTRRIAEAGTYFDW
jgi:Tol biopolymer transport system component